MSDSKRPPQVNISPILPTSKQNKSFMLMEIFNKLLIRDNFKYYLS